MPKSILINFCSPKLKFSKVFSPFSFLKLVWLIGMG